MSGAAEECPHCGALVPAGRLSCRECGSDANTGWQSEEEVEYRSLEIPDWDESSAASRRGPRPWFLVGVVLTIVAILTWLRVW